ncbi:hypothetical protein B0H14DRAFT_2439893 [Mycena olivaceomarginata]|nr:hypothetical protein B0H14DRAFT_2439893 [Mycena olivaceomarginata]
MARFFFPPSSWLRDSRSEQISLAPSWIHREGDCSLIHSVVIRFCSKNMMLLRSQDLTDRESTLNVVKNYYPTMASGPTHPPAVEVVQVSGPLLIAQLLQWALFGTLTLQLYLYYQAFPKDRLLAKCMMYSVYCIQLVDIVLSAYDAFQTFGYGFGSLSALSSVGLSWFASPVIAAIVSFIVQSFYAFRLHVLSKSRIIPVLIVAASISVSISGFLTGRFTWEAVVYTTDHAQKLSISVGVWLIGSASIDIIIAVYMTYVLLVNDTGLRQTHALITKLIRLSIETGSVTALVAVTTAVLFYAFPERLYYIVPVNIIPMVYANTMLAVQNSRFHISGGRSTQPSSTDVAFSLPLHVQTTGTAAGSASHPSPFMSIIEGGMDASLELNVGDKGSSNHI